eukprot:15012422-Alexandrium_andersonii.AAC.1
MPDGGGQAGMSRSRDATALQEAQPATRHRRSQRLRRRAQAGRTPRGPCSPPACQSEHIAVPADASTGGTRASCVSLPSGSIDRDHAAPVAAVTRAHSAWEPGQ